VRRYGGAVAAWSRFRISYAFIFGAVPGTEMRFAEARRKHPPF
jgi:hypothetical protein